MERFPEIKRIRLLHALAIGIAVSILLAGCSGPGHLHFTPEKRYAPQQLQADLQIVEQTLRTNHPSLHWYASPDSVTAALERARLYCRDSMTEAQFRNLLNETLAVLRCGHTSVRHSYQYNKYFAGSMQQVLRQQLFPLQLKVLNDTTLVITSNSNRHDTLLQPGMQVTAINNRSAGIIIDTLRKLVPLDGYAVNFAYQNISNNFPRFYQSRFPNDTLFMISYRDFAGKELVAERKIERRLANDTARLPQVFRPQVNSGRKFRNFQKQRVRQFQIDSANEVATLRLNTFTNSLQRSYLRRAFRKLHAKQTPHLILDLRNNGGGLIQSSLLLTRFIKKEPFRYADSVFAIRRNVISNAIVSRRFITNAAMWLLNKKVNDSLYNFRFFSGRTYEPHKKRYNGQVWVLTGGYSFSATTMFLANVKGQSNVTLIGEETGGGYYGNNGVFIPDITLPNTRLRMRLPLYRIVINGRMPNTGSGVPPDVWVAPTAETIRQNRDVKTEKAVALIQQRRKRGI